MIMFIVLIVFSGILPIILVWEDVNGWWDWGAGA
jgi:hypothetical protein